MLAGICARLLQIFLAVPVGWLADIYGIGLVTLATAIVQMCAGIPFFLALQSDPLSATNVFVTYAVGWVCLVSASFPCLCVSFNLPRTNVWPVSKFGPPF